MTRYPSVLSIISDPNDERSIWSPQPGMQSLVMGLSTFEILAGGAKGAGKSMLAIGWLVRGNPRVPDDKKRAVDLTYTAHPQFRALALRKNIDDLNDWTDQARPIYEKMGATYTKQPREFTWATGAKIILGHLAEEDAYQHYSGGRWVRLFIDEVTYIPSFKLYQKIYSCCRSNDPDLAAQILLTANPEGPGQFWVEKRFINFINPATGQVVPPKTEIREVAFNPVLNRKVSVSRIYIPGTIFDNPKLQQADPMYYNRLLALEEPERSAYLYGDWSSMKGTYFREFRPAGPRANEPPEARHVIKAAEMPLAAWWPRVMAMDVGYTHAGAVAKACMHPNGQLIVYGEMVEAGVGNEEWGSRIARWMLPELNGLKQKAVTLWLSHDAFGHRGDPRTRAEQIQDGINKILGPNACFLLSEEDLPGADFGRRLEVQQQARIVLRRAANNRVDGWQYLRGLLRFRQLSDPDRSKIDWAYFTKLQEEEGPLKAFEYLHMFDAHKPETLPKILFTEDCPGCIRALLSSTHDPDHKEDVLKTESEEDDIADMLRYLAVGYRHFLATEPADDFVSRKVREAVQSNPNLRPEALLRIREKAADDWESKADRKHRPFSIYRGSPRLSGVHHA